MYSLSTILLATISALIVGLISGLIGARRMSPDSQKQREMERSLEQLLQQQKDYQHEVVEHFTETAELLQKMAGSYRDVHNHLAEGASNLITNPGNNVLSQIPEIPLSEVSDAEAQADALQQPLDYAPKVSPHQPGVLNEGFGLEREKPADATDLELIATAQENR